MGTTIVKDGVAKPDDTIVIKKGIPIPRKRRSKTVEVAAKMEVGDCIDLPFDKSTMGITGMLGKALAPWKFVQRRAVVDGVEVLRVWRTA